MRARSLSLTLLDDRLAICRFDPGAEIPAWALRGRFVSVTRTAEELSVVCAEASVPPERPCERGWRGLVVQGPLDLAETGILAALALPLAEDGIPIFAISTHDTDYVLVRAADLARAVTVLRSQGHRVGGA